MKNLADLADLADLVDMCPTMHNRTNCQINDDMDNMLISFKKFQIKDICPSVYYVSINDDMSIILKIVTSTTTCTSVNKLPK